MILGLMGTAGAGKDTAGKVIAEVLGGTTLAFADPIKRWCMSALKLTERQLWGDQKEKPISKAQLKAADWRETKPMRLVGPMAVGVHPWSYALSAACDSSFDPPRKHIDPTGATRHVDDTMHRLRHAGMRDWWNSLKGEKGLTPRRVMQHFGTEYMRQNLGEDFWTKAGLKTASKLLHGDCTYHRLRGLISDPAYTLNAVVITDCRFRNEVLAIKRAGGLVFRIDRDGGSRTKEKKHASEVEQSSVPQFWLDGVFRNRFDSAEHFADVVRYFAKQHLLHRVGVVI